MTTVAAPRPTFIPFDEEESAPPRRRAKSTARRSTAWILLPVVALLALAGSLYIAQTARGTSLTYQIASLQAQKAQLANTSQVLAQQVAQTDSAGLVQLNAAKLGLSPSSRWSVITPAPTAHDPLLPVLLALKGA